MIELKQLRKRFRGRQVLQGIDLSIERGHRIALIGSNGAGKTTLIRCLLGEYRFEGEVLLDGVNPRVQREQVLAKVGFVPQLPPPLRMPVGQLIRFSSSLCQSDPKQIHGLAAELGFDADKFRSQPFVKLSGGQKQKLLIAIALGRQAEILVMDEPAANLDPAARKVFFQILAEKKERSAMLISSHRLDEVASLVNRVIELDQGTVILDDRVADLVDMSSSLSCKVGLIQPEPAFAQAIGDWGFESDESGRIWNGSIPGPDRLRFLALLSRYAALLASIQMQETPDAA
ncbi:ABC transporter ATP-binding protein [Magnetovirga frankeli]|uniref:ABC transporter ATP-binding protein n=1 Tax=Magnetovirga frankeli TaxID=947516 RepID=UPI0012931C83|nr:ABC transporter ATP-binding protein [gamma proteobacterium SS-5]